MARYHVTRHSSGGWQVKRAGASRASARVDTQADGINTARRMAKNKGGGSVYIHRPTGEIRDESTFGSDPYPPSG